MNSFHSHLLRAGYIVNKYIFCMLLILPVVVLTDCSGGGGSPSASYRETDDTYGGPVNDSRQGVYDTELNLYQTTDYLNKATVSLYFVKKNKSTGLVEKSYEFLVVGKTYAESFVPYVDSHLTAQMATYPPNVSVFTGTPICHLNVDLVINDRVAADVNYNSPDCGFVGKGSYRGPFINHVVSMSRKFK